MEPIVWLVVGLIAGWLARLVMKGSGYGLVGDILVGILGGVLGALLFVFIVPADERSGFIGTIVVAVIGAAVFVGARACTRDGRYGRGVAELEPVPGGVAPAKP